jgi:ribosomal protein S2
MIVTDPRTDHQSIKEAAYASIPVSASYTEAADSADLGSSSE